MRPVRYAIATVSALTLVVATVATVAAGRVAESVDTIEAVHVDSIPAADLPVAADALRVELAAGTDGDRFLDLRPGGGTTGSTAFRVLPSDVSIAVDPSLGSGTALATFTATDGRVHTLSARLRGTGAPERWTAGPYAVTLPGVIGALRTCTDRRVTAAVDIELDGAPLPAAGSDRFAELVIRTCSTVALYR